MAEQWVARIFDDLTGEMIGEKFAWGENCARIYLDGMERRQPPFRSIRPFIAPTGVLSSTEQKES